MSAAPGTEGRCQCTVALPSPEQALLRHARDIQGGIPEDACPGMPSPDLPCLQFNAPGEEAMGWQGRGWQVGSGTLLPWGIAQKGHTSPWATRSRFSPWEQQSGSKCNVYLTPESKTGRAEGYGASCTKRHASNEGS